MDRTDGTDVCQFLKCKSKDKAGSVDGNPEDEGAATEQVTNGGDETGPCDDVDEESNYVEVEDATDAGDGDDECVDIVGEVRKEIFAKEDDDGHWLLRWNFQKQHEGDFIALCYEGELSNLANRWRINNVGTFSTAALSISCQI